MSERLEPTERPEMKNAFGLPIYEISDVVVDREIEAVIQTAAKRLRSLQSLRPYLALV
ncbi:hypothetical protein HYV57_04250 [Candidatus Peregrinibacteria bacterium]|nr:hypothetical protein [Candidatus Peregrinibacteria bacterium]